MLYPPAMRHAAAVLLALLALPSGACGPGSPGDDDSAADDDTADDDTGPPPACWDDLAPGAVETVVSGLDGGTEGISFHEGRLWVTRPDALVEVLPSGEVVPHAPFEAALGLAPAQGGLLVADPGEFTFDGSGDDGRLWYASLGGTFTRELAAGMPNPNFVAATPWGAVLVSDDTGDPLYQVDYQSSDPGEVTVWTDAVPSANGMAFSADAASLYAVSTFAPDAPVWRVAVEADGTAGEAEVLAHLPAGSTPDGVALDVEGGLWVAANLAGQIWRVDTATGDAAPFADSLDTPASLAFGAGDDWDPCSIYFTELYGDGVDRLAVGVEGLPVPVAVAPPDF
ncbi:SMP-30/gluconolactonase/LRE family protein [Myxococcota bacterium]|nr:SMP-30/gluconolactonase/LRE family protein [Myxococcota bacterium]